MQVTLGNLTSQVVSGRVKPTDPVSKAIYKQLKKVPMETSLAQLSKIFEKDHFCLAV